MNGKNIKTQFTTVPFKASSPNGLMEYNGIAKFSPAGIVIEFDSKYLGLFSGEVKEVQIGLEEVLDIKFRRGIYKFFAQIQLRLTNFAKISELPNDGAKVKLKIKREDFELAQNAVIKLQNDLNELQQSILPSPAPYTGLFDESENETKKLSESSK